MRAATAFGVVAALLTAGTMSACGGGTGSGSNPATSTSPPSAAALELQKLAGGDRGNPFTAIYTATHDTLVATATVYFRDATNYRVDFTQGTLTAAQFGTPDGTVACSIASGVTPVCGLLAGPGKPLPSDIGIERVFTRDLPALAGSPGAFTVTPKDGLAATTSLAAAQCFAITATRGEKLFVSGLLDDVDLGTYCLGPSGPPRQLEFASGSLVLQSVGPAPTDAQLTPPAPAPPLPTPTATPSGTPSAPLGLLGSPAAQPSH